MNDTLKTVNLFKYEIHEGDNDEKEVLIYLLSPDLMKKGGGKFLYLLVPLVILLFNFHLLLSPPDPIRIAVSVGITLVFLIVLFRVAMFFLNHITIRMDRGEVAVTYKFLSFEHTRNRPIHELRDIRLESKSSGAMPLIFVWRDGQEWKVGNNVLLKGITQDLQPRLQAWAMELLGERPFGFSPLEESIEPAAAQQGWSEEENLSGTQQQSFVSPGESPEEPQTSIPLESIENIYFETDPSGNPQLVFPAKPNGCTTLFLGVWLTGWTIGTIGVTIKSIQDRDTSGLLFMIPFWIAWFVVVGVLLWNLFNRVTITIGQNDIRFFREILFWKKEKIQPIETFLYANSESLYEVNDRPVYGVVMNFLGEKKWKFGSTLGTQQRANLVAGHFERLIRERREG